MPSLTSLLGRALSTLLSRPAYAVIWALGSLVFLAASVWIKTSWFLPSTLQGDWLTLGQKVRYLGFVIGTIVRSDVTAAAFTLVTGLLFGAALALYIFVIRRQRAVRVGAVYPVGGFVSALLGFGCAACGTLLLSFLGLGAAVTLLPLRELEFTFLAMLLLAASIVRSARAIVVSGCSLHQIPAR